MKLCPRCHTQFSDDTLNYCLNCGTGLPPSADPSAETLVIPSRILSRAAAPVRQGVDPVFAIVAIGLLALVAGGAIVAFVMSRPAPPINIPVQQTAESPKNSPSIPAPNKQPTNGRNDVVQYPDSSPQALTDTVVENLLSAWKKAQETNNFATYQACYDPSFVGVKTTKTGGTETFDYNGWMADRRPMIASAVNLSIEMRGRKIKVEGDTATVAFDQYYRSLKYSDWGPKEIVVKMMPAGAKIVREELKASNPL